MKPIEFLEQNSVHKASGCLDLPTNITKNEEFNQNQVTSCWELDDEDIINILKCLENNEKPCIYLSVIGGQPPVILFTK